METFYSYWKQIMTPRSLGNSKDPSYISTLVI